MIAYIPAANKPAATKGTNTKKMVFSRPAPSIIAASSTSLGMESKKDRSSQVQKGATNAVCTKINPKCVSAKPVFAINV